MTADLIFEPPVFGVRLRRLREAAGLTQEELAERAGVTAHAVSALERGVRTRPYPHTVRSLAGALGATKDERAALLEAVPRRSAGAPQAAPDGGIRPLPAATTSLIGREADVQAVAELLVRPHNRLVTLTGTGGVGKTRLSVAVGERLAAEFPDGVTFVSLAPVPNPALVLSAIGHAVGGGTEVLDQSAALAEHLRRLRLLLLLDNFEHLTAAAAPVAGLLSACPQLRILVTSRAALRVRGETEYPVRPLPLPPEQTRRRGPTLAAVAGAPAVRLFVERARSVAPGFRLTESNATAVAAICARLAGIPLALELAATRTRFLDPSALLDRLDQAMSATGARDLPERQRSLRATLDWSYNLLTGAEQRVLRLLSVFPEGFSLNAAEAVAAAIEGGEDALEALERLVEHSMVTAGVDAAGHSRYIMLAPIASYARDRLVANQGEADAAGRAHAEYFLALAERAAPEYQGADQLEWLARVDAEDANMTAAMRWSLEHGPPDMAARFGWALWLYWWLRGYLSPGRTMTQRALVPDLPASLRCRVLCAVASLAYAQADIEQSRACWQEAYDVARDSGDLAGQAPALAGLGLAALATGDADAAAEIFRGSLDLAHSAGREAVWVGALTQVWLGTTLIAQGDLDGAIEHVRQGLSSARRRGDRLTIYVALFNLSEVAIARHDHERARGHLEEGILLSRQTRDLANLAFFLDAMAVVEGATGRPERLVTLLGAAMGLREAVGWRVYGYYRPNAALREAAATSARSMLGADGYDDALDAGRSLSFDDAVAYALRPA